MMPPRLASRKRSRSAVRLAWFLWGLCVALISTSLLLGGITPDFLAPPERLGYVLTAVIAALSLACPTIGALIASRFPANPVGWIFCTIGLFYGARRFAAAYADQALLVRPWLPGGELTAWASTVLGLPVLILAGIFLVLLFPDGVQSSRYWPTIAWSAVGGTAMVCLSNALRFGPLTSYYYAGNPFGVPGEPAQSIFNASAAVGATLLSTACAASIVSLVLRLHKARGDDRQQLGWFACSAVPALFGATAMMLDLSARFCSWLES